METLEPISNLWQCLTKFMVKNTLHLIRMLCVPTPTYHSTPMHLWEHPCPVFCTSFLYLVAIRRLIPPDPSLVVVTTLCFLCLFSQPRCSLASRFLGSPAQNLLQHADIFLVVGCPKLDRALKVYPQELPFPKQKGWNTCPDLLAALLLPQPTVLYCKDTLLTQRITWAVKDLQGPEDLFLPGCFLSLAVL